MQHLKKVISSYKYSTWIFALDKKKMVKAKDLEKVKTLEDLTRLKDPKATSYGILQTKYKGNHTLKFQY